MAEINSDESVNNHPMPIPIGPVLEKMRIILIDVLTAICVLLKLIPRVRASAHLCSATANNKLANSLKFF